MPLHRVETDRCGRRSIVIEAPFLSSRSSRLWSKFFSRTEFFIGGGVGQLPGQPRLDSPSPDPISAVAGERGPAQACSRAEAMGARGIMLGRHVYRVQPTEHGWTVIKEGENRARADLGSREEALAEARRMARAEEPSKVVLGDGDGFILEEELFGQDMSDELDA